MRPETTGPKTQRWQQSIRQGGNVANFAGQTVATGVPTEYFVALVLIKSAWSVHGAGARHRSRVPFQN